MSLTTYISESKSRLTHKRYTKHSKLFPKSCNNINGSCLYGCIDGYQWTVCDKGMGCINEKNVYLSLLYSYEIFLVNPWCEFSYLSLLVDKIQTFAYYGHLPPKQVLL